MGLIPAGRAALVDGYVGYHSPMRPATTNWNADKDFHEDVRNGARSLVNSVRLRRGEFKQLDSSLHEPRSK